MEYGFYFDIVDNLAEVRKYYEKQLEAVENRISNDIGEMSHVREYNGDEDGYQGGYYVSCREVLEKQKDEYLSHIYRLNEKLDGFRIEGECLEPYYTEDYDYGPAPTSDEEIPF